ncbi:MAG: hypothetical protein WBL61_03430 [Bryobacteraceae bacterium]
MLIAGMGLTLLLVAVCCRPKRKMRPFRRADLRRVRRLSEQSYRENTFPFE